MTAESSWPEVSDLFRLDGKVVVVTGAGTGIGRQTALTLASAGAKIVAIDREKDAAVKTATLIAGHNGEAVPIEADVSDANTAAKPFEVAMDRFGKLDGLVNNAGVYPVSDPLPDVDWDLFDKTFNVNLKGALRYSSEAARRMKPGSAILNMSSIVSLRPSGPGIAYYSTSKAALNALTRASAVDLAPLGIRVNSVLPGIITTPGTSGMESAFEYFKQKTPSGRIGLPEDIANAVLFLLSPAASFINGQNIVVDGGASIVG